MGAEGGLRRWVRGLREAEFRQRYGTEEAVGRHCFRARGHGLGRPFCGHGRCAELKGRVVYQCNRCKRQVGLTAGTVFHWTKLPLTTWFLAIYHFTQSKYGMSSVEQAGCTHFPMITGSGSQAAKWAPYQWVNTALGNIKTALAGTYHHVSAKHAS